MTRPLTLTLFAGVLGTSGLQPAPAQEGVVDEVTDRRPERCISLNRLDSTEVIDDRTLIFHMRGGDIFLNHLARECPGLKREERFMYSPTSNRLCNIDTVTVLEQWGFGMTRGFTCSLGQFHPIVEAELEDLRRVEEGGGGRSAGAGGFEAVPVDPADLEDAETDAAEENAADTRDGDSEGSAESD